MPALGRKFVEDGFPIQPGDIDAHTHLWDSFDSSEAETSAGWIVRFCQWRGMGWTPFALEDLLAYYWTRRGKEESFQFNGLDDRGYVPLVDGAYHVTEDFVTTCHKSSPTRP